jgi:Zn-dependent protease with chaperone function
MDEMDFRGLVARSERESRDDPRRFARITAAMALFGYAVILAALGGSACGLVWGLQSLAHGRIQGWKVFLVIGCASLLFSLLRALWIRSEPPQGIALDAAAVPRLFELIDRVCKRTAAPRPDRVWLDGDLNAAVLQQPRLGLLGWHRNHLILGLPLLMGLSQRQLGAVLAHEFGHLSAAHGKLGMWIYRTRRSWTLLLVSRQRAHLGGNVADLALAFFFRHYFPRFNARAFVLSRQQEFEADRAAHELVGPRPSAEGLQAIEVQARFLHEHFWPGVYRRAGAVATPEQESPYRALRDALPASLRHPQAKAWLAEALKRLADLADTHPSLRDRLEFAAVKPALPAPAEASAASAIFGERLDEWIARMDARWREQVARAWGERHRAAQAQRHMIGELEAERAGGLVEEDDHLLWARAVRQLDGDAAGERVLRQAVQDRPTAFGARHELGVLLVDDADAARSAEGAGLLRGLAEAGNHPWAFAAAQRYEAWLEKHERFDELKTWRPLLRKVEQHVDAALEALHDFEEHTQHFEPAGLSRRALRGLQDLMRGEKAAGRVCVVRKSAAAAPGWRFCVVIVERSKVLGQPDAETWWAELRERIELPCPFMVVDLAHPYWRDAARKPLIKQMLAVPNAQVYASRG